MGSIPLALDRRWALRRPQRAKPSAAFLTHGLPAGDLAVVPLDDPRESILRCHDGVRCRSRGRRVLSLEIPWVWAQTNSAVGDN